MKIQASYNDTVENLTFFAEAKGWVNKINVIEEYEDTDPNGIVGIYTRQVEKDNPITLEMFLVNWAKELLLKEISGPIISLVENKTNEQAKEIKESYLNTLNNNLEVITE